MTHFATLQGLELVGSKFDQSPFISLGEITNISWRYDVSTNEMLTVGGKVIQAIGVTISKVVITGSYGIRGLVKGTVVNNSFIPTTPPKRWQDPIQTQQEFLAQVRRWMEAQRGVQKPNRGQGYHNGPPLKFVCYSNEGGLARDWNLDVYIMDLAEQGFSVAMTPENFNPQWMMTLLINQDNNSLVKEKNAIMLSYINRASQIFGWFPTTYNGPVSPGFYPSLQKIGSNPSNANNTPAQPIRYLRGKQ